MATILVPLFMISFSPASVNSKPLINGISTKLIATCDHKELSFEAKSNNIRDALQGTACELIGNDTSRPDSETILNGGEVTVEVNRALNVEIIDNGIRKLLKSGYSSTFDILKQLEIVVDPKDKIYKELILENFLNFGPGQRIVIERAPIISIEADGAVRTVHSWEKTVNGVLIESELPLGAKDEVLPQREKLIFDGGTIIVTRVNEAEVIEEEAIKFQTITKKDYNLYQGKSSIEQEGSNGQKQKTFKVIYKNGIETERTLINSEITSEAVNRVVIIGVKPYGYEELWPIMVQAGSKYGVAPEAMFRVMMCESGGNNHANTAYKGIFQWDSSFYSWAAKAGFSNANILDTEAQIYATALRVSQSGGWGAWGCKP